MVLTPPTTMDGMVQSGVSATLMTNVWGEQAVEIVRASLLSDGNAEYDDVHIEYSNHACSGE